MGPSLNTFQTDASYGCHNTRNLVVDTNTPEIPRYSIPISIPQQINKLIKYSFISFQRVGWSLQVTMICQYKINTLAKSEELPSSIHCP